ncbi:hypothetical protein ABIF65_005975 [Bradyrhizobium japonicum]|uniref:Uncharacterized protein n=1 Tax=Bradyrhizobium barranii subsp. barranii TaxID=2823807 RepID=A0A939MI03_9BRAD|nr:MULTISPECIES: hypothetical protein [Bradyrhizobium]MBR1002701.1 hypothetical protein [Bradyrhizobium liaoningense]MBR1025616.1 hypothetical protein [Bradyrhizobium liaoningense]MBR1068301.1 hypothetical protein [Bradyrhizobium liaoningense]MCP1744313.1 hypothetical protein [Bradyrhizobium japonicum]MCP1782592.1 hypothetical protein [Bradyrhizobium japonicum]
MDFSTLVLLPGMTTFAISVTVRPEVSQPGAADYAARGVFSSAPTDVQMQDGTVFSDQQTTLGIRMVEWAVLPVNGDRITINEGVAAGTTFWVADSSGDGQGGMTLTLRKTDPPE